MTKRVAILISGGGSNMVSLVKAMQQDADFNAEPVLVLANSDTAGGLVKAVDLGVETQVVDHRPFKGDRVAFETLLHDVIVKYSPDVICLAGFMRVLTPSFIDKWTGKMINIHPSLLPKYKGLHTHQRAIDAGDSLAGCSIHVVTSELDGGPVLAQTEVAITPDETADTLAAKVLVEEHKLYPAALKEFVRV